MSMAPTQLLKAEHDRVFREVVVLNSGINDVESVDASLRPKAIILAGQPGAGKGGLTTSALREFRGNAVIIDTDACRDAHPEIEDLRRQHPYTWSDDTHPDASSWARELMDKAVAERKNIIFDTTLSNGGKAVEKIKDLMDKGYDVEVRAMATSKLESELGVDQRFTRSVDQLGFGRFVPVAVRDEIFLELPNSLNTVAQEVPMVPISVHNREGKQVFPLLDETRTPGQALTEERGARVVDVDILRNTHSGWCQQKQWHEQFVESAKTNPKLDEQTVANLVAERENEKVVLHVDVMKDRCERFLERLQPSGGGTGQVANEQQSHAGPEKGSDGPMPRAKL